MQKIKETYVTKGGVCITLNLETNGVQNMVISLHDAGEPCSGLFRHWGSPERFIKYMEDLIEELKKLPL